MRTGLGHDAGDGAVKLAAGIFSGYEDLHGGSDIRYIGSHSAQKLAGHIDVGVVEPDKQERAAPPHHRADVPAADMDCL